MASWLSDTQAKGKTIQDWTDGTLGTVLEVHGEEAEILWEDGTTSLRHEDFLTYVD